ncbi:MAG: ArsR/SmtB family transcription factor [Acidimicrobiales bacterium]
MTVRRQASDAEAKALASSLRLQILRICIDGGCTNKEIADILGRDPASTLHHIRTLVRTGFLEPQEARRGTRGAREIPYLATKKSWRLSNPAGGPVMLETFLTEVALVPTADVDTTRLGMRLGPAEMAEFRARLQELLDDFADRVSDPSVPAWSLFIALHPDPNRSRLPHPTRDAVEPATPVARRSPSPG